MTSAAEEISGRLYAPAALPPGKELPAPIGWAVGGRGAALVWARRLREKAFAPVGNRTPII